MVMGAEIAGVRTQEAVEENLAVVGSLEEGVAGQEGFAVAVDVAEILARYVEAVEESTKGMVETPMQETWWSRGDAHPVSERAQSGRNARGTSTMNRLCRPRAESGAGNQAAFRRSVR